MAPKSQEMLRKQKAAKQKKIVFLLVPVLLIAVVFNAMRFLGGGEETTAASSGAAETSSAPADTSGASAGTPTPAPTTGAAASAPVPAPGSATLVNSDVPPPADEGQLVSFERFIAGNPFEQQVSEGGAAPAEAEKPSDTGAEGDTSGGGAPGGDTPSEPADKPNTAMLTVNGAEERVGVGGSFPASDPTFKLVAIKGETAKIGLVTGSFSTGADTIDLKVGQTLTLVSQPDGIRYVIKLVGLEVDSTAAAAADGTTDAGTATVPTTTVPDTTVPSTTGGDSGTSGVGDTVGSTGYGG